MSKQPSKTVNYSRRKPKDYLLAHNLVRPTSADQTHGLHGFRVFWVPPEYEWVECDCGWRPDLGPHYRGKSALA
jgi:hypothetical protein